MFRRNPDQQREQNRRDAEYDYQQEVEHQREQHRPDREPQPETPDYPPAPARSPWDRHPDDI